MNTQHITAKISRIKLFDIARGAALVAMAIYHFTWDLDFFGYIEQGTSTTGGWRIFARLIAISFLFLVGISLYLAHGRKLRLNSFIIRLRYIVLAAIVITMATLLATPDSFIFFGILHHIALASVLGLAFLQLPITLIILAAVVAAGLPLILHGSIFDYPFLWWLGFSSNVMPSNDFVPLFPLFSVVLLGIATSKALDKANYLPHLAKLKWPDSIPVLSWIGKHSLAFYLIHQPILMGLVWAFSQVVPAPQPDLSFQFQISCSAECVSYRDAEFCQRYCGCLEDGAKTANLMSQIFNPNPATRERLENIANQCLMDSESTNAN